MLLMFLMLSWMLSIIFMFLNHPLSFGFILLLQTIIVSISSGLLNFDYWFSYILFLVMIGGMLVLFIYMTSIASNEKFKLSQNLLIFSVSFIFFTLMILFMDKFMFMMEISDYDHINQSLSNIDLSKNKYLNYPNMMVMIILMVYLLVTLVAIVKITNLKAGPLRQKF